MHRAQGCDAAGNLHATLGSAQRLRAARVGRDENTQSQARTTDQEAGGVQVRLSVTYGEAGVTFVRAIRKGPCATAMFTADGWLAGWSEPPREEGSAVGRSKPAERHIATRGRRVDMLHPAQSGRGLPRARKRSAA